jgi:hypothetical protein
LYLLFLTVEKPKKELDDRGSLKKGVLRCLILMIPITKFFILTQPHPHPQLQWNETSLRNGVMLCINGVISLGAVVRVDAPEVGGAILRRWHKIKGETF